MNKNPVFPILVIYTEVVPTVNLQKYSSKNKTLWLAGLAILLPQLKRTPFHPEYKTYIGTFDMNDTSHRLNYNVQDSNEV